VKKLVLIVFVLALGFLGGIGYGRWYGRSGAPAAAKHERRILYWVDGMHPWYKSDKPGIAPDCGMKLTPVYEGEEPPKSAAMPAGTVEIPPAKQQLIGVEYGAVSYAPAVETIRAAAKVALDETKIAKIQTRIEGWIDQVFVDFTGKQVSKGQPLLTIYSPEALATQQEFLLALRAKQDMARNPIQELASSTDALYSAARRRLQLWDISDAQIDHIVNTGKTLQNLTLYAPFGGFVMERNAYPKQRVTPETVLYTVADLSTVWVIADVFEYEAANVHMGQAVTMTLPYLPGRTFRGRVSYILPQVDPATRTLKVRIEFPNPGFLLKPDMYGEVEFQTGGAQRLMVPQSSVLNSGAQQTVFVDRGNGFYEPRQVRIGQTFGDRVEVLSGLKAGERIVTSGNFLLDSESQLHDQSHH
jgi:RND family efflux transporter MFP subunit